VPYDKVLQENIEYTELEEEIVNLEEFQRLKFIKQNGFAYVEYTDAINNRYNHSIGTMYWAEELYKSIERRQVRRDDSELQALRLAALIHDIGHGPFSHAIEILFERNPELLNLKPWSKLVQKFGNRKPHELLTLNFVKSKKFKEAVPKEIVKKVTKILTMQSRLSLLISGDLDADRLDYLTRDSQYSGLPFGFNVKAIFNELLQQNLEIITRNSKYFLCINRSGVPAFEQLLMARYAHYYYIAYQPKILLANLVFVSELEKNLWQNIKEKEKIGEAVFHIFTKLTDDEILNLDFSEIEDSKIRELLEKIQNSATYEIFRKLKKGKIDCNSKFIRLPYLEKMVAYNLLKSETAYIKEIEEKASQELKQSIKIYYCLPKALTTKTFVLDNEIDRNYRPSLLYDYSPVIRALEQKMYFDCGILISSDKAFTQQTLINIIRNTPIQKNDFDMYTYAIYKYIQKVQNLSSQNLQTKKLRRSRIFEFLKEFMEIFYKKGKIKNKIDISIPWYSKEFYEVLQKLEFLDFLSEDFNLSREEGFIPSYVYTKGEYAESLLTSLGLTKEEKSEIEKFLTQYPLTDNS